MALPAWVAWIVQVPVVTNVTEVPFVPPVVQTPVVRELKLTGRLEDAVAATVIGDSLKARSGGWANVIAWVAFATVNGWSTGAAAL